MKRVFPPLDSAWLLFSWLTVLTCLFTLFAALHLSDFQPVSSDEIYIISVTYKLASRGVLGSDLLQGFFNADQHFFINLPGQSIWQATVFRIFGAGIAQARWISLGFGILLLWAVSLLAYRWFGLLVAIITGLLLLFWRSSLIGIPPGIPFLAAARSARYDLSAVSLSWLAIFWLNNWFRNPSALRAMITGALAGLAALTHFTGLFIWLFILMVLLWHLRGRFFRSTTTYWIAASGLIVVFPYIILALSNLGDFLGQYQFIYEDRANFASAGFYVDNLIREFRRFKDLTGNRTPGPWILVVVSLPALIYLLARFRASLDVSKLMLIASLLAFEAGLAMFDRTKAPIYALILLPSLCIISALFIGFLLQAAWSDRYRLELRLSLGALGIFLLGIILAEGFYVYYRNYQQALIVSPYEQVGDQLRSSLIPEDAVLGAERWWWPMREHRYVSLRNLYSQWLRDNQHSSFPPEFSDQVSVNELDVILINDNVRGDISRYSTEFQGQFWHFVERCTSLLDELEDRTYGEITVYRVRPNSCSPQSLSPG